MAEEFYSLECYHLIKVELNLFWTPYPKAGQDILIGGLEQAGGGCVFFTS